MPKLQYSESLEAKHILERESDPDIIRKNSTYYGEAT